MGNLEKLVVITVLFLVAILAAWTVMEPKDGGGAEAPSGPLAGLTPPATGGAPELAGGGAEERGPSEHDLVSLRSNEPAPQERAGATDDPPAPERVVPERGAGEGFLLDATPTNAAGLVPNRENERAPADDEPAGEPAGAERILTSQRGLVPSPLDDHMTYTAKSGDTWDGLALRFYQDGRFSKNLRAANEGLEKLDAGREILVPIYDLFAVPARAPLAPQRIGDLTRPTEASGSSARDERRPAPDSRATSRPTPGRAGVYEVKNGDSLSKISLEVYGSSKHWRELYEANRDRLADPHSLKLGLELRVPVLGTTPVPAEPKAASGSPAPTKKKDDGPKVD